MRIKDAKGKLCGFCVGADLSDNDNEDCGSHDDVEDTARLDELPSMFRGENLGFFKKAVVWICGLEKKKTSNSSTSPPVSTSNKPDTSIDQHKFWSVVCDINAVIAIALCGFCFAFFNKYN